MSGLLIDPDDIRFRLGVREMDSALAPHLNANPGS
jgi:hypothetical protein